MKNREKYRDAILQDEPEGQAQALPDYSSEQSCRIR